MLDANAANILVWLILAWANLLLIRILRGLLRPPALAVVVGVATDLTHTKADLIAENALLRHQLALLKATDRLSLLLLARVTRTWRQALLIVQPATLLRWHREGYRLFWRWKSGRRQHQSRITAESIVMIRRMVEENPLWGGERIRGELLKLGIDVAKRTIQRHMGRKPVPQAPSQSWSTFLRNHAPDIWACDFIPVIDVLFRQLYVFVIV